MTPIVVVAARRRLLRDERDKCEVTFRYDIIMSRNDIAHGHKSYRGRRGSVVKRGKRRVRTRG